MNRLIHGAVRRDLAGFTSALVGFPDGSATRGRQLLTAWKFFYGELDYQHHSEHEIAWPAPESVGIPRATLDHMDVLRVARRRGDARAERGAARGGAAAGRRYPQSALGRRYRRTVAPVWR